MSTIRKRGNRWEAQVRKKGQAPISKSFIMKSDALEWGRTMELAADRRSLPYDPRQLDGITLKAMLEKYRDEVIPKKRAPKREINMLNAFIARSPKLAAMSLSSLSPAPFCTYRDQRLKTVKPATICRELGLIQHAYDIAEKEWGYPLQENPVAKVKKPEIRNRRERRLTWSEFKAMQKALKQCENKEMEFLTLFAVATGMRRSEILALEWRFVNFNNRTLHIPMSKNGYARTIPLTRRAMRVLLHLSPKAGHNGGPVFSTTEEGFRMAWRRAIRRAGIVDLHFHDLRHEAVSRFFEFGLSVPEVALISGHRDYRMLFRYTHLKPEDLAEKLHR